MKKLLVCLLISVSLLFTLALPAFASDAPTNQNPSEWLLDESGAKLTRDGELVYYYYGEMTTYGIKPGFKMFIFQNYVQTNSGDAEVFSYGKDGEIMFLSMLYTDETYIYCTSLGEAMLEGLAESGDEYILLNDFTGAITSDVGTLAAMLDELDAEESVEVTTLKNATRFDIYISCIEGAAVKLHGAVYEVDGELLYINYDVLTNNYFDSEGNFSYKKGSVNCAKVISGVKDAFDAAVERGNYEYSDYVYETTYPGINEDIGFDISKEAAVVILIVIIAIFGIIIPFIPLIYSINKLKKKAKDEKATSIIMLTASAVWIACAIAILILIL